MKTVICYYSRHHGNTLKVLEAMAEGQDVELIDVTAPRAAVHLERYDAVGFASGIYYGKFHDNVTSFARQYLPEGKDVFFIYTCGSKRDGYTKVIAEAVTAKRANILGEYGCRGYDTFGPFKLVGGIAKGHPNADELQKAREFFRSICK
ncbi:MAG: flavodoxin family protein [Intestinimonas sp.]|jgi:flavodoxin|nr:flavodoxin family protein [Intestinimonas sp.]